MKIYYLQWFYFDAHHIFTTLVHILPVVPANDLVYTADFCFIMGIYLL